MSRKTMSLIAYVKDQYDQGYSVAEIARELDIPYNTAKYWLKSAHDFEKKMREYVLAKED